MRRKFVSLIHVPHYVLYSTPLCGLMSVTISGLSAELKAVSMMFLLLWIPGFYRDENV
jgi:hypothetical protein